MKPPWSVLNRLVWETWRSAPVILTPLSMHPKMHPYPMDLLGRGEEVTPRPYAGSNSSRRLIDAYYGPQENLVQPPISSTLDS